MGARAHDGTRSSEPFWIATRGGGGDETEGKHRSTTAPLNHATVTFLEVNYCLGGKVCRVFADSETSLEAFLLHVGLKPGGLSCLLHTYLKSIIVCLCSKKATDVSSFYVFFLFFIFCLISCLFFCAGFVPRSGRRWQERCTVVGVLIAFYWIERSNAPK